MSVQVTAPSFDPELFVGRKKKTKLFIDTVRAATRRTYLEFNGIAGQGKSELLKWIYHHAKNEGYIAAYVDFELPSYHRPELYPILETIAAHLTIQTSPDAFRVFHAKLPACLDQLRQYFLDSLENPQKADRRPLKEAKDNLVAVFNQELSKLLQVQQVVLCLDSTEKAYLVALRSFEDQVLQRHVQEPKLTLVTAGQKRVAWKNDAIKSLITTRRLSLLDPDAVQEQVARLAKKKEFEVQKSDAIFNKMFQLTMGHPFSNYKLVDVWTKGFTTPLNERVVEQEFSASIPELIEQIIEGRILERLQLSEEYPPARDILWYLAPLRRIEFGTLWYVLSTFLPDKFQNQSFEFFERLMEQFQKTYIFMPFQLGIGYELEPVVRNMLLWNMLINNHDQYLDIQKALAEQYKRWTEQSRDETQIKNMVERFYHYALYLNETQTEKLNESVQKELQDHLNTYFTLEFAGNNVALRQQLNRLHDTLKNDDDLLKQNVDVLNLLNIINEFKNELPVNEQLTRRITS